MSAAIKYRLEAYSEKYEDVYRVDILEEDYVGAIQLKNIGTGKIVLSKSEGIIQKTTLEISIQSDTNFEFTGFMQYDNRKYPVKLYKNDVLIWQGYHVAESYSEPYQNPPYDVTIIATDNLGFLENYIFKNTELPGRLATTKDLTRFEAIDGCLNNLGLPLYYEIAIDFFEQTMNTNESMLHQSSFLATIFNGENCKDVVESLLPYGAILTQHNNRWLIRRPLDDAEKTHILYTFSGDYFGTETGETLLTMGDYLSSGIWPHGKPLLELEHAWEDALIIKDYGKIDSFLQNFNFSSGTEDWTDYSGGNLVIVKDVGFYYARINGYSSESGNDYIETGINLTSTSEDFVFECLFDHIAYYVYRTPGKKSITVKIKIQVTIGSYYLTTEGWTTSNSYMEFEVGSSVESPNWKSLRVIASTIPATGELKIRLFRANIIASDPNYDLIVTHIGTCFTNVKISTDALIEYPSPQKYRVNIRENAAGGNNEIRLKPVDTPPIENAKLIFENANYVGSLTSGLWSNNGATAQTIEQALANQIATYYSTPRHKISGCNWRGIGLHLNAIAQHSNNNNRKFIVTRGTWNILEDTFNVTWIETAGTGSATAVEDSEEQPASEPRSGGITPNPGDNHPPVTIDENSQTYAEIGNEQILKIIPEDYSWFLHTPDQVIDTLDEPTGFQETVDGGLTVIEQIAIDTYTVTALNANGETTGAGTPSYLLDIHEDTTQALFEWTAVTGATGYRIYKAGQYMETVNTYFDHLTWAATGTGNPPAENTAVLYQNQYEIEKSDVVEFKGVHIDVETTGAGTTKTVTFTGHPEVSIATGSAPYLSINGEQELSIAPTGFQSDWEQTDTESIDFIKNKPTIPTDTNNYATGLTATGQSAGTVPTVSNSDNVVKLTITRNGGMADLLAYLGSMAAKKFWVGTQAEYDAIGTKDANTIYHIEE